MPGPFQHPVTLDAERGKLTPEASEWHLPGSSQHRGSEWLSGLEDHATWHLSEPPSPSPNLTEEWASGW